MPRVNATAFLDRYIRAVRRLATWDDFGSASRTRTKAFTVAMVESARSACEELGLATEAERPYRLDMTGFDPVESSTPASDRHLRIAFEHEYGRQKWRQEFDKLLPISADLKVLVGYELVQGDRLLSKLLNTYADTAASGIRIDAESTWLVLLVPGIRGDWTHPWEAYASENDLKFTTLPLSFSAQEFSGCPY